MKSFIILAAICALACGANKVELEKLRPALDVTVIDQQNVNPELAMLAKYTLAEIYLSIDSNNDRAVRFADVFKFRAEYDIGVTNCNWHVIFSAFDFIIRPSERERFVRLETTATSISTNATNLYYFHLFSSHEAGETCEL